MFIRKIFYTIMACMAGASFTACNEKDLLPPANTNAYFSFISTSTTFGVNGSPETSARAAVQLPNGTASRDMTLNYLYIYPNPNQYLPFTEGSCQVAFKDSVLKPLTAGTITTQAGTYYTAILADSLQHYSTVITNDSYELVPGKALVRVMHFSPDAGEIAVYRDAAKMESFGAFKFKTVTPYIPIDPGENFSFILRKNDGTNERVARYFTTQLLPGAAYTILLKGYMTPPDGDVAAKSKQIVFYRN